MQTNFYNSGNMIVKIEHEK